MMKVILILIPLIIILLCLKSYFKVYKLRTFKVIFPAILLYLFVLIIIYKLIVMIPFIDNLLNNSETLFYDKYIFILMAASLASIVVCPIMILVDKIRENNKIKDLEQQFEVPKYDYYRDLIKDIPPAMLAMIYNPKSNIEDQITATFINLEHKGVITTDSNNIINVGDMTNLWSHEKYVVETLLNKNRYDIKKIHSIFKSKVIDDLKEKDLLLNSSKVTNEFTLLKFMEIIHLFLILTQLITITILTTISSVGVLVGFSYFISFMPIIIYSTIYAKAFDFIKNNNGIELKVKLDGLKKFLETFSNIHDRSIEEIKLYDDYILYTIIFNIKGNINEESNKI